jgi:Zn-dependent membrane protease YugP
MFYGLNSGWFLLMIVSTVIGLATQGYINSTFRKWSRVPLESGKSGSQVAREILDANGLTDVGIQTIGGQLTDNYDPRSKVLSLSEPVYGTASVSAAGVAAHESGHAIQDAKGYVWGAVRSSLVPVAGFGSKAAWILIFIGIFLRAAGSLGQTLILLGILLYAGAVLFQLVTLPVEFDASRRAVASLQATGQYSAQQLTGVRQVLTAAGLTYVAGALIAILQLLYLIGLSRRN